MGKSITITNGSGTSEILTGTYSVTVSSNGYDESSITPSSVQIKSDTSEYKFSIAGNGTLTLHVSEDGTSGGKAVVGAKFIRTDSSGTVYGSEITTDSNGNAIFANVPYSATNAPNIYFKQTLSDGEHEYSSDIITVTLDTITKTYEIMNALPSSKTIILTDSNYENLPIESAIITLT